MREPERGAEEFEVRRVRQDEMRLRLCVCVVHLLSVRFGSTRNDRTPPSRAGWFYPDTATPGTRSFTGPNTRRTAGARRSEAVSGPSGWIPSGLGMISYHRSRRAYSRSVYQDVLLLKLPWDLDAPCALVNYFNSLSLQGSLSSGSKISRAMTRMQCVGARSTLTHSWSRE